jgi:hypothetical protein
VQCDFLASAPDLSSQVTPVQRQQSLAGDKPEPEKRGQPGVGSIAVGAPQDVNLRFLKHVGWVDSSLKPAVQPEPHHSPQLVTMAGK